MMRPQSTKAAKCRRSVAGAMPWARRASCWLEGKTIRPSPLSVVSGWKLSNASRTASARSDTPILALAVQIARNTCHLCTALSGGRAFAVAWRRHMGERQRSPPKGRRRTMGLHFKSPSIGQKKFRSPKRRSISLETLDSDSRKWDSQAARNEKGFRNFVSGAFFFCLLSFRSVGTSFGFETG